MLVRDGFSFLQCYTRIFVVVFFLLVCRYVAYAGVVLCLVVLFEQMCQGFQSKHSKLDQLAKYEHGDLLMSMGMQPVRGGGGRG
jgi:hypothetical protein